MGFYLQHIQGKETRFLNVTSEERTQSKESLPTYLDISRYNRNDNPYLVCTTIYQLFFLVKNSVNLGVQSAVFNLLKKTLPAEFSVAHMTLLVSRS